MEKLNIERATEKVKEIIECPDLDKNLYLKNELYKKFIRDIAGEKYYSKEEIFSIAQAVIKAEDKKV